MKLFVIGMCLMGAIAAPVQDKIFNVQFNTNVGSFVVKVHPRWAPIGTKRFHALVTGGFYQDIRFFRVLPNFMAQFGIHGDPMVSAKWRDAVLKDDPVKMSNKKGYLTFATSGPNTRTTQLFINFQDNAYLDSQGFAPFAEVVSGMDVVKKIYAGYGQTPEQSMIQQQGNTYLSKAFPLMTSIKTATVL